MLGLLLDKFTTAESRLGIDEFIRAERSSAFLALVTVCSLSTATWACTGNIAVSKEGLRFLVIVLLACLLDELSFVVKFLEEVRCVLVMGLRRRA